MNLPTYLDDDAPKESEMEKIARLRAEDQARQDADLAELARKTREAEERRQREKGSQ